jgi:1-acyl-sn-glycerol-3-phosphate acyltransferase
MLPEFNDNRIRWFTIDMKQIAPRYIRMIRLARLITHVVWGVLQAIVYPHCSRKKQQCMMKNWAGGILKILHINLQCSGEIPEQQTKRVLLVANHISWLDICVMMAASPTQFVAKSEIRNWPVIGFLCKRIGTLFIERAKRSDTLRINREISNALRSGERVCIFPEAGTSDGTKINHFHASLLQSAIIAEANLYPVAIRYLDHKGDISRDAAYIDVSLVVSLQKILKQPCIDAVATFSDAIHPAGKNRRELARLAEHAIANTLSLPPPLYHTESEKPSYLPRNHCPAR